MEITNAVLQQLKRNLMWEYRETCPISPDSYEAILDHFIEKLLEKLKQ